MKKYKILISLFLFMVTMLWGCLCVNAASLFNKDWSVVNNNVSLSIELISSSKGVLITGFAKDARSELYLYDENGELSSSKKLDYSILYVSGFEKGGAFYLIGITDTNNVVVDKYSDKLEKLSSKDTGYFAYGSSFSINNKDDVFYLLNNNGNYEQDGKEVGFVLVINTNNLNDIKTIDGDDFIALFPNFEFDYNSYNYSFFIDGVLSINNDDGVSLVYGGNNYTARNGDYYVDVTKMGNYVLGLSSNIACMRKGNSEQQRCSYVDVLDSSMNFIERIDVSGGDKTKSYIASDIVATSNNSFVVVSEVGDIISNSMNILVSKYSLPYNVETKTNGHGNVKVSVIKAASGTIVKFTITPEDGYVLDVIKVTDSDGNVVYFKDNTFTMPSADVLVEATFVKKEVNPETGVKETIAFASFITIGGILLLTKYIISVKRYE